MTVFWDVAKFTDFSEVLAAFMIRALMMEAATPLKRR
jgi:hypothetical protein